MMIQLSVTIGYSKSIRNQRIAEELSGSIYGVKSIGNDIKLGSMSYKNIEILVPTKNTYHHETTEVEKHGSIGGNFFNKSTIVLDYSNGLFFIENNNDKSNNLNDNLEAHY